MNFKLLFLALGGFLWSSNFAQAQSDNLIVPCQRIGHARVGMFVDDMIAALGQPRQRGRFQDGSCCWFRYSNPDVTLETGSSSLAPQIYAVATVNGNYRTQEGVRVGSSGSDVVRAYGRGREIGQRMDYRGVTFFVQNGHLVQIHVRQCE